MRFTRCVKRYDDRIIFTPREKSAWLQYDGLQYRNLINFPLKEVIIIITIINGPPYEFFFLFSKRTKALYTSATVFNRKRQSVGLK